MTSSRGTATTAAYGDDLARLIVEGATDFAIFTTKADGTITSWNPGAENILDWSAEEAIGQHAGLIFTPEDQEANVCMEEIARAEIDGRSVNERWHVKRDGSRFWGSGLMMPLRDRGSDKATGFVKMMRDRTTEREADRRYHAMTASLPCILFATDTDGNCVETNLLFQSYTGREAADLNGARWLEVVHGEDLPHIVEEWRKAVSTGEPYEVRHRLRRHDGEYRYFICRAAPERDALGRVVRWLGTCVDVDSDARAHSALERLAVSLEHKVTQGEADLATAIQTLQAEMADRQQIEEALRHSQKIESLGQLTGGLAHDFNNLLTVITSSASLLRRSSLPEEKRRFYIDAIAETAERAAALTQQLLAFARRQPLQPEVFSPCQRLQGLLPTLRTMAGSGVEIAEVCGDSDALVLADPLQFESAVINLAVNARDAMDGVGRITIRVAQAPGTPGQSAKDAPAEVVAISVTDTGKGIQPDDLSRIFEPFFTTKAVGQGTGLGLSQVIGFAQQSGGDVKVESDEGRGTTFTLYLPRGTAEQTSDDAQGPERAVDVPLGTGRVLLVEDNQTVGEFASQLLEELGYSSVWASNAQSALDLIEQDPERFDLVLSDVVMPGMSGVELARTLRETHPKLRVALTSGYSHVLADEGTHGFDLLRKPYSVEALGRVLKSIDAA